MRLIADVGGTNSRLALCQSGQVLEGTIRSYSNRIWDSFYAIIDDFLLATDEIKVTEIVLAVAGPVRDNQAHLTNRDWLIESDHLTKLYGNVPIILLNDSTALGYAVPTLQSDQLTLVSAGAPTQSANSQSMVVGIGTGLTSALSSKARPQ